MYKHSIFIALALIAATYSLGTPQCTVSNKCTQVHQWMNDGVMNTQFACELTNMGSKPISHVDIRLNDNQNLYNTWEIATSNNGLSWDFVKWREQKPLEVGLVHKWGYIVKSDKPLNIEVCEKGFVNPTVSPSPSNSHPTNEPTTTPDHPSTTEHNPTTQPQTTTASESVDAAQDKSKHQACEATFVQKITNYFLGKDHLRYTQVEVTVSNIGKKDLSSVIIFTDVHFNSTWGIKEVDPINAPGNYEVIKKSKSLAAGSDQIFSYVFVSDNKVAPMNLISNACQ
ncbi:hypothetical protein CYY_009706 [Polysphondylium violaceum]|uniref:Carbohydrate binding domain-containing protein n=1 Tax=Polysphondylium violaceum TaxID=133409 RepID=A0A8J4PLV2_9MYCE|nr:hypothetical protein CYY_009706 [Polysphondylium violaceum]